MDMTPDRIPIIETRVFKHLTHAVQNVARTAGLGIAKGPVGIGKTFAIDKMLPTLEAQGITAFVVTVIRTAMNFEESMAQVDKVLGMSEEGTRALGRDIVDLSLDIRSPRARSPP